jgi:hypothetical protein
MPIKYIIRQMFGLPIPKPSLLARHMVAFTYNSWLADRLDQNNLTFYTK